MHLSSHVEVNGEVKIDATRVVGLAAEAAAVDLADGVSGPADRVAVVSPVAGTVNVAGTVEVAGALAIGCTPIGLFPLNAMAPPPTINPIKSKAINTANGLRFLRGAGAAGGVTGLAMDVETAAGMGGSA